MKPGYSVWIKNEQNERIFGAGPFRLLQLVATLGSLNKAAKKMNLSYSKAFNIIKRAEKELKCPLLEREVGGIKGGGSTLTPEATDLLDKFQQFQSQSETAIETIFLEIFKK
jgi:molybdate transport system regulatory protein